MIADNLRKIRQEIALICQRIGRNPSEITLIAITKSALPEQVQEAIDAGISDIGENRIQEAQGKYLVFKDRPVKFHLVGHLQTNKAKAALEIFDLIHSVDSVHLAQEIEKVAAKIDKKADCLVQVNISAEKSKFGISEKELNSLLEEVSRFKHLEIKGLMTIASLVDVAEEARPYFRRLRLLKEKIEKQKIPNIQMQYLSMGMTNDYKVAIEEGSNMLRIGRAIFEPQINTDI